MAAVFSGARTVIACTRTLGRSGGLHILTMFSVFEGWTTLIDVLGLINHNKAVQRYFG